MSGYLHHALHFLPLSMVKGKSHQANGVVVKSDLVVENKSWPSEKAPTTSCSHSDRRRAPPQGSRRVVKVFTQSSYQIYIGIFPSHRIFHQLKTCSIPFYAIINLTAILLNAGMRDGCFVAGSQNLVLGCRKLASCNSVLHKSDYKTDE